MSKASWPVAAGLPALSWLTVFGLSLGLEDWTALPPAVIAGTSGLALLATTALLTLAAPLTGLALARRAHVVSALLRDLTLLALAYTAVSALLLWAGWGSTPGAWPAIGRSHATMATAGLALGALGALCGTVFKHPLDAAAAAILATLMATAGLLLAGPSVSDAPRALIAGALLASPLVTTAAAAGIDILRTDVIYRVSPLASIGTEYADWYIAIGVYSVCTAVCLVALSIARTKYPRPVPSRRS